MASSDPMTITIPLRTVSESNGRGLTRGAAIAKSTRIKRQRSTVALYLRAEGIAGSHWLSLAPLTVLLVRISPRALDDDNLRGALKSTRDAVAGFLGINDRDPRVRWDYTQRTGAVREQAVEITLRVGEPV